MGIHTLLVNLYAAYYVMDPSANENYTWLRMVRNDTGTYFGDDGIVTGMMKGFDISGVGAAFSAQHQTA